VNYYFVHFGNLPPWIFDSIESVSRADKDANIFLCTDKEIEIKNVSVINSDSIMSEQTEKILNKNIWNFDSNPLWRTSLNRIFFILDMMKYYSHDEFVHFDSDVILFHDFEIISSFFNSEGFYITPCNNTELVFGYSYCNSIDILDEICKEILKSQEDKNFLKNITNGWPSEMQILSGIQKLNPNIFKLLPTIPDENTEYVFDPSSYGQYLFGTHSEKKPGWYGTHHWIGELISQNKLDIYMNDGIPYVNQTKIVNLHIHSKNTNQCINNVINL
jgi:hypothetical protein